jgi:hypothetical protein
VSDNYGETRETDRALPDFAAMVGVRWPPAFLPDLDPPTLPPAKLLALSVLVDDESGTPNALASRCPARTCRTGWGQPQTRRVAKRPMMRMRNLPVSGR